MTKRKKRGSYNGKPLPPGVLFYKTAKRSVEAYQIIQCPVCGTMSKVYRAEGVAFCFRASCKGKVKYRYNI